MAIRANQLRWSPPESPEAKGKGTYRFRCSMAIVVLPIVGT